MQTRYPATINNTDTVTYIYDAMGNRLEKQGTYSGSKSYTIDNSTNRLTFEGGYYLNYDSCGNWVKKWHGDDPVTDFDLTYDYENRLKSVSGVGYGAYYMNAYYNADGVRLYKETNADLCKKYVVDGMNTVVEQDAGGSLRYKYVYVNGMLLSKIDASSNKYYYHHDGLGSIIGLSNSTPEVTTAQLFDDFGNWLYWDSNWDYYSYTGQEYDWPLTDAFNLRAREYYPEYGRFMQEDPILQSGLVKSYMSCGNDGNNIISWIKTPQMLSNYHYALNNPMLYTDPTGLSCGSGKLGDLYVPDSWFGWYSFEPACDRHDRCYGSCGKGRFQCDNEFLDFMWWICDNTLNKTTLGYKHCREMASIYYLAVRKYGESAYNNAQKCCK